jgi:hypothetical protein
MIAIAADHSMMAGLLAWRPWSALYGAVDALAPAPVVRFGSENERSQHRGFKPQLSLRAKPQPVPASLSATFRVASIAVPPSAAILRSRAST